LKILQISSASSFGGGERYVTDLTNSLITRGHDLYLAVRPQSPLPRHVQLPPEKILTLPLRNALDVPSAHELDRYVRRRKIEIVHAHMARDYSLAAYATRRNRETKFVATRHVLFQLNRLHRHTLAHATKVIAVSAAVARELRSQRILSDRQIVVVPNGVDIERFNRATKLNLGLPEECLLVGSIGELRTLKRHDDFIRAAALVPQAHFVLAGVDPTPSGEVRTQLEELVIELGLKDRFHFLGWLDQAERLLCALDVFVSASETESFGLVIAEAMAAGTAVVATETEGAKEVIEDQKTGMLVPIGDVNAIANAIIALLENPGEMGLRAKEAANTKFSLKRMVDEIERIYAAD
jgi:glycosyltransferase involved in cell wall biosynthesis